MIPRTQTIKLTQNWQESLSNLITKPEDLFERLDLDPTKLPEAKAAQTLFPLRVTQEFVSRIERSNFNDPLLKQILPLGAELELGTGYSQDPLGEQSKNPVRGVIHKYHGRVLLITSPQCAINCRYCFRRHFDYSVNSPNQQQWRESLTYIQNHPDISEVILSGGDPLTLGDSHLSWLLSEIAAITHIKRVRIHSRIPIVLPNRITGKLLKTFSSTRLKIIFVVHCNHSQEIDEKVKYSLQLIKKEGITLLNQAVLLNGVNNDLQSQVQLSETLFDADTLPYYLHLFDKVTGAAHFDTPEADALALYRDMQRYLPGYLVPQLVRETAEEANKTRIN